MRKYNGDRVDITDFLKKYGNEGKEKKIRFRESDVKGLNLWMVIISGQWFVTPNHSWH